MKNYNNLLKETGNLTSTSLLRTIQDFVGSGRVAQTYKLQLT